MSGTLNPRIGIFFIMAIILSPGNFHSSAAYLPSSFAMYMVMVGTAAFMNWRGGLRTSQAMFWFAVGGVLGWPFASALCAPFLAEEGILAMLSDKDRFIEAIIRVTRGVVATVLLVVCLTTPFSFPLSPFPLSSSCSSSSPFPFLRPIVLCCFAVQKHTPQDVLTTSVL